METETLAEIDGSFSSKKAHSHALIPPPTDDRASKPLEARKNGARVSSGGNDDEGFDGDVHVSGDVETEISVEKSFGCPNGIVVVGGDGGFVGDAKVTGGSFSSEHEGRDKNEHGGGRSRSDSTLLIGDGSEGKAELDQNGISLVVEVHGSLDSVNVSGKNCGNENDKGSVAENGGDPNAKLMKIPETVSKMDEKGYKTGEGRGKLELNRNGEENDEGGEDVVENDGEDDDEGGEDVVENDEEEDGDEGEDGEEDEGDQEHEYLVGDFVWGKIRSHPWWPGQIYDASDASESARKYNHRERLLVAYFGDGSFSWCSPSQIKPFAENFEEMSKQSNSKTFVNAVQMALDEIGRLVELKMSCSCIPEGNQIGLSRPSALNAGIKQGALVPECDLSRLPIPQHGSAELLSSLRYIVEVVSIANMLELTVLRSWLSAFYQTKGGHKLAMYHEPLYIEGMEDRNRIGDTNINDFSSPVDFPVLGTSEEDWLSSRFGQTNQSLLQKCPGISEDKLYHRRKKKSVAELMKEDMVVEPNKKKRSMVKDITSPGKLVSMSGKKKMKSGDEAPRQGGSDFTSPSGRKRGRKSAETLGSPKSAENKVLSAKRGSGEDEEKTEEENVASFENDDMVVEPSKKKRSMVKDITSTGKLVATSGKKKMKSSDEAPRQGGSDLTSPSGRKTGRRKSAETFGSPKSAEKKVSSAKSGSGGGEEKTKEDNVASFENVDRDAKRETEAPSQGGSDFASPSGRKSGRRKSAKTLESPKSAENKVSSGKNVGGEGEEKTKKDNVSSVDNDAKRETEKASVSRDRKKSKYKVPSEGGSDFTSPSGRKKGRRKSAMSLEFSKSAENKVSSAKNGGGDGKEERETEKASASRERKKSKYLTPPYTSPKWRVSYSSSKRDLEESMKIASIARIGERMTRAAGQLIGSPPVVNCSDDTIQEKKELNSRVDTSAVSTPQPPGEDHQKIIDSVKINVSTKELVSEIRAAAFNPLYLRDKKVVDVICKFISAYRSAIYLNGSNYKMYHRHRSGRKRKPLISEPGLMIEDLNQTDHEMPESKSQRTRHEKNEQPKSGMPKLKQAGGALGIGEASTPTSLIVTFPPGSPLPSKNDLIAVFSKFGPLNETDTDVLYNSNCARVVFVKSSDAEKAFKTSIKKSPLGPAGVSYRLRYSSAASRARKDNRTASSPPKERGKTPVNPSATQHFLFIKRKLEVMTSMLEKSDRNMSPEMKSKLEGEMKGLLEEVSTMAKSPSSERE